MKVPIAIKRKFPSYCRQPDYSRVLYMDPPSHDFMTWLVIAEMMRRYHGAPAPLKVRFMLQNGMLGAVDYGPFSFMERHVFACSVTRAYSDQMIENVLLPAMEMMNGVRETPDLNMEDLSAYDLEPYIEYSYHLGHLVDAARQGHEVPRFQPPQWAFNEVDAFLKGNKPVIITLRETDVQPERNSDIAAWIRFAYSIKGEHPVLFLRDTCKADEPLWEWPIWPRASTNAFVRAALYRRAFCNLMVGNGPVNWCTFSHDAPILIFKQLVPALPVWPGGQPIGWLKQCHMEVGEQLPWSSPRQRLVWQDDSFENIKTAFDDFLTR